MIFFKFHELVWVNPAKRDKIVIISFILSFLINVALMAALIINFFTAKEFIILRFNIYFGISKLGPWYEALILPLLGLAVTLVNFLLSFYFYLKEKLLSYLLAVSTVAVSLILLLASILIIYINS